MAGSQIASNCVIAVVVGVVVLVVDVVVVIIVIIIDATDQAPAVTGFG